MKINKSNLVKLLNEKQETSLVKLDNYLFHITFEPNKEKLYTPINKYDNILFSIPSYLENELNKEDIIEIDFKTVSGVLNKISYGIKIKENKLTGNKVFEDLKPYTQEDFIRFHYLKHKENKNILLYGPDETQNKLIFDKYIEILKEDESNKIDKINNFTTKIILNNLYDKLKYLEPEKTLIDINPIVFNKYVLN